MPAFCQPCERHQEARAIVNKIANGQDIVNFAFALKQGKPLGQFYVQTPLHAVNQLGPDGKTAVRVPVKVGRASVNSIQVLEGLQQGDNVILSDMSRWDNTDRIRLN